MFIDQLSGSSDTCFYITSDTVREIRTGNNNTGDFPNEIWNIMFPNEPTKSNTTPNKEHSNAGLTKKVGEDAPNASVQLAPAGVNKCSNTVKSSHGKVNEKLVGGSALFHNYP